MFEEGLPVEDRIGDGTDVIGDAADVVEESVEAFLLWRRVGHVNCHQALKVSSWAG